MRPAASSFVWLMLPPFGALALGCAVPVAAGLDESDANRVVVALDQAGVDAAKETDPGTEGKFRVSVPHDDVARALSAMSDEALPPSKSRGAAEAHTELVPSPAKEHADLATAIAGDLERTLGSVDGVLSARVHLSLPLRDGLRENTAKSTASVLVAHRGTTPPLTAEAIQKLVAGGAAGLSPNDVTVVFVPRVARAAGRTDVAHVGPIAVTRGSMTALRGALAGLVAVILVLTGVTLGLYSKLARLRAAQTGATAGGTRP